MTSDELLSVVRSSTTAYYEADGLGSITSLSSTGGPLANTYTYDSYGRLTSSTGTLVNPFQYTGREADPETGFYEYRSRYYDENVGRFISEDRFRSSLKTNRYTYVSNRPTALIDPSGKQEQCKLLSTFTIPWFDQRTTQGNPKWKFLQVAYAEEPNEDAYGEAPTAPVTSLKCLWEKTITVLTWGSQFKHFSFECEYTLLCGEKIHYYKDYWEKQTWWKSMTSTTERIGSGPFPVPYTGNDFLYERECEGFGPPD